MKARVRRAARFEGVVVAPGDKSVSHRALILGALAEGRCEIENLAPGADVRKTARALAALGARLELRGLVATVEGRGLGSLASPDQTLDCGNSGTSLRLLAAVAAGSGAGGVLSGDDSLQRRPMRRLLEPLRVMGALARGAFGPGGEETAPLTIEPSTPLTGCDHALSVASAQVKSGLLLAGLWAEGTTRVTEPGRSRDHTERMLRAYGAPLIEEPGGAVSVRRPDRPMRAPRSLLVPGDPSSAAFLLAAAALVPGGTVSVRSVDVNPTRSGFFRVLERMGAALRLEPEDPRGGEPVATLHVSYAGSLRAVSIGAAEVPSLVDELPVLAVLASQACGASTVRGAGELRVKESDRLAQIVAGLRAMGAAIDELPDGFMIEGPAPLRGALIDAAGDHRIAMAFAVAGLIASGETAIEGAEWVDTSYPAFFALLSGMAGGVVEVG